MWKLSLFNYRFSIKLSLFKDCPLYNKQKNTWVLGNTRFVSRVVHDISLAFAALTREISCSTLEINMVFPRTHLFSMYYYILYYTHLFAIYQFSETLLKTVNQNSKRTIIIFIHNTIRTPFKEILYRSLSTYTADAKVNQIYICTVRTCMPRDLPIHHVCHTWDAWSLLF
jgi:hypothetical protein